jgi:hypothetical protein
MPVQSPSIFHVRKNAENGLQAGDIFQNFGKRSLHLYMGGKLLNLGLGYFAGNGNGDCGQEFS